jgi:hypothetical protein
MLNVSTHKHQKCCFKQWKIIFFLTFGSTIAINQIHMKQNKYVLKC